MNNRRFVVSMIAVVAFFVLAADSCASTGSSSSGSSGTSAACSPKPCASKDDFTVVVNSVDRNLPGDEFSKPETGNHFVRVMVTFSSKSSSEQHANPTSFVLKDAAGIKHDEAFSAPSNSCPSWSAVNLTNGSTLGPKPICFEAGGDPKGALTLVWTPSLFGGDLQIPLP